MLNGLFLDPRSWKIDIIGSPFWKTKEYGVSIDLDSDAFNIPKRGINPKYKFVIATEVWEIPMRKTLKYLRDRKIKIFLLPREPFKTAILKNAMFSYNKFLWNNEYYHKPDVVLAPGKAYADLWQDKTKAIITGHPKFDIYSNNSYWKTKEQVAKLYGLNVSKRWIFFPSYPPYHYKKQGNVDTMIDLYSDHEMTLEALKEFAIKHSEYQIIVKIHPVSMKCYLKGSGVGNEVAGTLKKYFEKPTDYMHVIGDERFNGSIAKDLLTSCDIVAGFTSTMLLEAGLIGKPSVHILFGKTKELEGIPEYLNYVPTANNKEELFNLLVNANHSSLPINFVNEYLFNVDGKACERICEAIKKEVQ